MSRQALNLPKHPLYLSEVDMSRQMFNFPLHLDSYQVCCILRAISFFGDALRFNLPDNEDCSDEDRGEFVSEYLSFACSNLLRSGIIRKL